MGLQKKPNYSENNKALRAKLFSTTEQKGKLTSKTIIQRNDSVWC